MGRVNYPRGRSGGGSGPGGGWSTLLDASMAGTAAAALADYGTISRGGLTWTLRTQSASLQTWTPETDGVRLRNLSTTFTTSGLNADLTDAGILGRVPDTYDLLYVQTLWENVVKTATFSLLGAHVGGKNDGISRGGVGYGVIGGHTHSTGSRWFARVSNGTGFVDNEDSYVHGAADLDNESLVAGGLFLPGLGVQACGAVRQSTPLTPPTILRDVAAYRKTGVARPALDIVGAFVIANATSLDALLTRVLVQHMRLPGAPDPA